MLNGGVGGFGTNSRGPRHIYDDIDCLNLRRQGVRASNHSLSSSKRIHSRPWIDSFDDVLVINPTFDQCLSCSLSILIRQYQDIHPGNVGHLCHEPASHPSGTAYADTDRIAFGLKFE